MIDFTNAELDLSANYGGSDKKRGIFYNNKRYMLKLSDRIPDDKRNVLNSSYKLTNYFEQLEQTIAYRNWFFGHYHKNMELDNRHMVLYDEFIHLDRLIRLQDGPNNERDKVEEKLL